MEELSQHFTNSLVLNHQRPCLRVRRVWSRKIDVDLVFNQQVKSYAFYQWNELVSPSDVVDGVISNEAELCQNDEKPRGEWTRIGQIKNVPSTHKIYHPLEDTITGLAPDQKHRFKVQVTLVSGPIIDSTILEETTLREHPESYILNNQAVLEVHVDELKKKIRSWRVKPEWSSILEMKKAFIALTGPLGAGKSTFANSILAALRGFFEILTFVSDSRESVTKEVIPMELNDTNIVLIDYWGWKHDDPNYERDLRNLAEGILKPRDPVDYDPSGSSVKRKRSIDRPKITGVVLIFAANNHDNEVERENFKKYINVLSELQISPVVGITKYFVYSNDQYSTRFLTAFCLGLTPLTPSWRTTLNSSSTRSPCRLSLRTLVWANWGCPKTRYFPFLAIVQHLSMANSIRCATI